MIQASIIIPVFNNSSGLHRTLESINHQNFPKERFEVIVVDNGSDDEPRQVVDQFREWLNLELLEESNFQKSPYSARNRGIEVSKGDVIVLLDSTCAAVEKWLEFGLGEIKNGSDLVG